MKEEIIPLSGSCEISIIKYGNLQTVDVSIEYTEHSPYAGYGDAYTTIDIDKEKAIEIVKSLIDAFSLKLEEKNNEQ